MSITEVLATLGHQWHKLHEVGLPLTFLGSLYVWNCVHSYGQWINRGIHLLQCMHINSIDPGHASGNKSPQILPDPPR